MRLPPLDPSTPLARFVDSSKKIRAEQKPRVRSVVFMPSLDEKAQALALSTHRVDGLDAVAQEAFGREWAEQVHKNPLRLKASCLLPVSAFNAHRLRADFDDEPPRHVNVLGWPVHTEDQLEIAEDLCAQVEEALSLVEYR